MANDRYRMDEQYAGPERDRQSESGEDRVRSGMNEDVRGVADEGDDEFEEMEDLEEDEESDGSY